MHPIERLRYVARSEGGGPSLLVREAAGALAGFASEPPALVTAARRLVDRHPQVGPLWWLAARVLAASDPSAEAWRAAEELEDDPTAQTLAALLPDDAAVVLLGWPELAAEAVRRRGDIESRVIDADGEGTMLSSRLRGAGLDSVDIEDGGLGPAVADSRLVILEASAMGPDGFVAPPGSLAAAAVARACAVPVWLVAGVGRVLPGRLWTSLVGRLDDPALDPWERPEEVVALAMIDEVVGPKGSQPPDAAARRADCPIVAELLKPAS